MKNIALGLMAGCLALSASFASAQSCDSAVVSTINAPTGGTPISGNTCQQVSTLVNVCQNQDAMNGAGVSVYALALGTNSGVQVSVTSTGADASTQFVPFVALIKPNANNCSSGGACLFDNQAASGLTVNGTVPDATTPGTYWIVVGDTGADSPGCGPFNLEVSGTLPVKLEKFSVD
jgi:hypothetical protein